jgi:elongation factor P--(R)-beta-lysine ligase
MNRGGAAARTARTGQIVAGTIPIWRPFASGFAHGRMPSGRGMNNGKWWDRDAHARRRPRLLMRHCIKQAARAYFERAGFVEVESAVLQRSPGNETHLHAFATDLVTTSGERSQLYLHTSPEFACKKLLAAGEERIFDFARVFRNRERGALHHPEFTMLEWYRAGETYSALMEDCAALLALAADTAGVKTVTFRGGTADPFAEAERLTVAAAFERFAGIDLLTSVDHSGGTDAPKLIAALQARGIRTADDDTWSDAFSRVMVEKIELNLGMGRPTILYEYPLTEAALARPTAHDRCVAERFEFYICGVELANGFGELTDPTEQRRRFQADMAEKRRIYGEDYPIDEDFLAALAVMPQASGCALGFDRLVMLATGAQHIEDVLWTPVVQSGSPVA